MGTYQQGPHTVLVQLRSLQGGQVQELSLVLMAALCSLGAQSSSRGLLRELDVGDVG